MIYTEQGANFESDIFSKLFRFLNISKTRSTPDHLQCDGQVENINRTLNVLFALNVTNPTKLGPQPLHCFNRLSVCGGL